MTEKVKLDIEAMVVEAERGYDVDEILARRRGRPVLGSSAASIETASLPQDMKRDLLLRAAKEKISFSEALRRAVKMYLHAG